MIKKITAFVLALLIVSGVAVSASTVESRFDMLRSLEVMVGYGEGDLGLGRSVTRAEFTKMTVAASKYRNSVASTLNISPFADVMYNSWYAPYVYVGAANGLLEGYKDGTFCPDNAVTYEEAVTVALRLLGYDDSEFEYSWPYGQIGVAEKNGLCDGMNSYQGEILDRDQVSILLYNLLFATPRTSSASGQQSGTSTTASQTGASGQTADTSVKKTGSTAGSGKYIDTIGYTLVEDCVIVLSSKELSSVKSGYVYTNKGLYQVNSNFDYSVVGQRGTAILEDGVIISFIPEVKKSETYNIFSVSGNKLILFKDGAISNYQVELTETVYYDYTETTIKNMLSTFSAGDVITFYYNDEDELQYAVYREGELEGPLVVEDTQWYQNVGINDGASVVRNGAISSLSDIRPYDVVYYSTQLQNVWVYSRKVTGSFEQAIPNKDSISQIKLSGVVYDIDSVEAYKELSSGGSYGIGDKVTLILDRDGKVVDTVGNTSIGESYTVYQVIGSNIVVYKNGATQTLSLKNSDTAYLNGAATTVGNIKNQLEIGYTLEVTRDTDGTIDYITVIESQLDGPYTVYGSAWMSNNGIPEDATIMRRGNKVSASGVETNDIVYYSSTLNTVWAYCDSVTGVYDSAEPNQNMPTSVTVSGKTYQIEGVNAYNALSSNGSVSYGDTVTLLLGKDGAVADVAGKATAEGELTGFMIGAGIKEYTDSVGNAYSSNYVKIVKTDGNIQEYETIQDYDSDRYANQIVSISFVDGKAKLTSVSGQNSVYGTFSYQDKRLGAYKVDPNVEIIDVVIASATSSSRFYTKIYPQRLDGVTFAANDILYAEVSADNVVKKMILNDVTGDVYSYGIVTKSETRSSGMSLSGSYTYFDGATKVTASTNGSYFSVYAGNPVKIINGNVNGISTASSKAESMSKLMERGTVSSLTASTAAVGVINYALSPKVAAYLNTGGYDYQAITLTELQNDISDYTVTAYADKSENSGGRIRVLVAKKK